MLKWAVGQRRTPGNKRSPARGSTGSGPCYSIRRAAARLQMAARRGGGDKENCDGTPSSPRSRDSIYMRLDSLPAALRDVSNQLTPTDAGVGNKTPSSTGRKSRSRPRKTRSPKQPAFMQPDLVDAAASVSTTKAQPGSPLRIEYSPCPMRATRSLLALRRRLANTFAPPHHSLGALTQRSHDNPIYYTLQRPMLEEEEVPSKMRRRAPRATGSVSPLTHHLQCLRLGSSDNPSALQQSRITPPSAFLNSNLGPMHDVTDPRFLSVHSTSDALGLHHRTSLHEQTDDSKVLRKNSLRRVRTLTSTSEDGPPAKVAMNKTQSLAGVNAMIPRQSLPTRRRKSLRRRSKSAGGLPNVSALRGLGDGIFISDSMNCNSIFSNVSASSGETFEDGKFTLKRQGGFRRRTRPNVQTDADDICVLKFPRTLNQNGLTLPEGIPSPLSPGFVPPTMMVPSAEVNAATAHFGLTLPKGIPSPPSTGRESPSSPGGMAGIRPLLSSPTFLHPDAVGAFQEDQAGSTSASSSSSDTWNSHRMHFMKTPRLTKGHILSEEPDTEVATKSPLALVEERSRSRRCLLFASPGGSTRYKRVPSRRYAPWRRPRDSAQSICQKNVPGELKLAIYGNSGLLTIHVICGRKLRKTGGTTSNAYVKVALVPASEERTFHRTAVHRDSSAPWFDQKFSFEVLDEDLEKRVLVSVWHRDKANRRSEFLGCMSFAVKHAVKKEINGSFRLLSQSAGRSQHVSAQAHNPNPVMARRSDSSVEEFITVDESDAVSSPVPVSGNDDSSFLRHLELEPSPAEGEPAPPIGTRGGRTPFTTTRKLSRRGGAGFGFSVAWTQPPRVERVEAGQPADHAGLRPGDYVIFVDKHNVVTMPEEEVLQLIRSCGNHLTLELYRRTTPNGLVSGSTLTTKPAAPASLGAATPSPAPPRSSTTCSATTTTSLDLSKRRLHLPQVTFSSETEPLNREDARRRAVYQLLNKEQHFALNVQFGVSRFSLPLAERKDLISATDHLTLFQNTEELLRLTEDTLEQLIHEDGEPFGQTLGRVYHKKINLVTSAYRRYFNGLMKADCLLVAKTRNQEFMQLVVEPPVPRRRPDLTAFLHKPLEHYREVLKLLQTILNFTKIADEDYPALSRVVHELQVTYRDVTSGAGLMEPEGEGRPLLSLQDLESRLVFTRCKPFVLSSPGRQWIFGGDLSRVEGRAVRPFWALLFTDMMLFAKVSRDRVLFITEEPLSLLAITQAFFNIRKKATEFRLLMDGGSSGTDSPATGGCGPELPLSRHPKKGVRRRTVSLRAPTAELKAVWQNLIQRQIIYLNTTRGGTPASSPLESPDPPTTLSVATLDSLSLRRQTPVQECKSLSSSQHHLDDLIEHKCRQLGKSGASKGSALHLAQWMRGQLGGDGGPLTPENEPEPEVWSPETLRRHSEQLQIVSPGHNDSRCEELEMSDTERSASRSTERSRSHSTSDSQVTVRSGGPEHQVAVCRQCHKTCLANNAVSPQSPITPDNGADLSNLGEDDTEYDENWGPLIFMGMSALKATIGLGTRATTDPFSPAEVPLISVLPPTPETLPRATSFLWDDGDMALVGPVCSSGSSPSPSDPTSQMLDRTSSEFLGKLEDDDDSDDNSIHDNVDQDPPYRSLSSSTGLKRFGTLASLEMLEGDENAGEDVTEDVTDSDEGEEWDSDSEENTKEVAGDGQPQLEVMSQSLRGWTARAGSFVAEQMALFERLGEDSRAVAFLDRWNMMPYLLACCEYVYKGRMVTRTVWKECLCLCATVARYLRPTAEPQLSESPPELTTTSSDDCETSAATSGEEVWGTPTSGGEFDEESAPFPPSTSGPQQQQQLLQYHHQQSEQQHQQLVFPADSPSSGIEDEDTELMMDELLATPPLSASARGFPPRRRLEPLPEEEDTDSPPSSTTGCQQDTPSPEQGSGAGAAADICPAPVGVGGVHQPGFFHCLRLHGSRNDTRRVKSSKLLGFLSGHKTEDAGGSKPLFRLFSHDAVDDIPTTLPHQMAPRRENDKQLERRFWKHLRRRRGGRVIQLTA